MLALLVWTMACIRMAWRYPRRVTEAANASRRDELVDGFARAQSDAGRIAAVNDALADVEHDLDAASRWPVTAGWLALNGWLMAVLGGLLWVREPVVLVSLPIGLAAVVGTQLARRRGRRLAHACRRSVDRTVTEVAGPLVHREVEMPVRRQRGRRRRGR